MPWVFYGAGGTELPPVTTPPLLAGDLSMYGGPMSGPAGTLTQAESAPDGYLFCNGAIIDKATEPAYATLWGLLTDNGTTGHFGAFTANTATLPDFRGVFPKGSASGAAVGASGGSTTHTHNLLNHTHSIPAHTHGMDTSWAHSHGMAHSHINNHGHTHGASNYGVGTSTVNVDVDSDTEDIQTAFAAHTHDAAGTTAGESVDTNGTSKVTTTSNPTATTTTGTSVTSTGDLLGAATSAPTNSINHLPLYATINFIIKI